MSNSLSSNVVIDYGSTKQAALFFDHVAPLDGVEGVSGISRVLTGLTGPVDVKQGQSIISQLLPPDFGSHDQIADFSSVAAIGVSAISIAVGFYNCEPVDRDAREHWTKLVHCHS